MILMSNRIANVKKADFQQLYNDLSIVNNLYSAVLDSAIAQESPFAISSDDWTSGYEATLRPPNSVESKTTWFVRPRSGISEADLQTAATYGSRTYADLSVCKTLSTFLATL